MIKVKVIRKEKGGLHVEMPSFNEAPKGKHIKGVDYSQHQFIQKGTPLSHMHVEGWDKENKKKWTNEAKKISGLEAENKMLKREIEALKQLVFELAEIGEYYSRQRPSDPKEKEIYSVFAEAFADAMADVEIDGDYINIYKIMVSKNV